MKSFKIETRYQGITNSQMYADRYNETKYSEITGFDNVKAIMNLSKLNESAAKDLSFVVSNLTEEEIQKWITARVNEIFTVADLLFDSRETQIKKEKIFDIIILDSLKFLSKLTFAILAPGLFYTRYFVVFLIQNYKDIDETVNISNGENKDSIISYFKLLTFAWSLQFAVYYLYYIGYLEMVGTQLSWYSVLAAAINTCMTVFTFFFFGKEKYTIIK